MNIRGTDPAALTAVTDLFVAPAPARESGAPEFQRALSPPKSSEPVQASGPKGEAPARESQSKPTAAPERSQPADRQYERDETEAPVATTAEETKDQPVAETDEAAVGVEEAPAAEETVENSDEAATSLAVASTVVVDQRLPEQQLPQVNPELTGETAVPVEEVAVEAEPAQAVMAVCTTPEVAAAAAEDLPLVQEATVATEDATKTAVESTLDAAAEQAPEFAAVENTEPAAGIGVLPSALQPQATSANTKPTSRTSPYRAAATADDRAKAHKRVTDQATIAPPQPATPTETVNAVAAAEPNADEKPERRIISADQILQPAAANPAHQPVEQAAVELKSDSLPPADVPVVSELHSTQHHPQDSTRLTTSQPIANQAIMQRLPAHAVVRTTPQQPAPPPLHVDAARFLQRVAKAFEAASERGGEIRLRLSPPELGALRVEVNMSEQGLAARVEVENNDARTVLLENLSALRDRLAEQGLRLEKFDVDLSQREPSQRDNHQFPDQPQDRSQPRETRNATAATKQANPTQANPHSTPPSGWQDRQLNVIV